MFLQINQIQWVTMPKIKDIEAVSARLREQTKLIRQHKYSYSRIRKSSLDAHTDDLNKLLNAGHSQAEIVRWLAENGLKINRSTLCRWIKKNG